MTIQQELKIYKKALFHYRLSYLGIFFQLMFSTYSGFCSYFRKGYDISLYDLNQLVNQKPSLGERINDMVETHFWFPQGHLRPRINCLKQAIKKCEFIIKSNINQNE